MQDSLYKIIVIIENVSDYPVGTVSLLFSRASLIPGSMKSCKRCSASVTQTGLWIYRRVLYARVRLCWRLCMRLPVQTSMKTPGSQCTQTHLYTGCSSEQDVIIIIIMFPILFLHQVVDPKHPGHNRNYMFMTL